jgi:hypothetical protein
MADNNDKTAALAALIGQTELSLLNIAGVSGRLRGSLRDWRSPERDVFCMPLAVARRRFPPMRGQDPAEWLAAADGADEEGVGADPDLAAFVEMRKAHEAERLALADGPLAVEAERLAVAEEAMFIAGMIGAGLLSPFRASPTSVATAMAGGGRAGEPGRGATLAACLADFAGDVLAAEGPMDAGDRRAVALLKGRTAAAEAMRKAESEAPAKPVMSDGEKIAFLEKAALAAEAGLRGLTAADVAAVSSTIGEWAATRAAQARAVLLNTGDEGAYKAALAEVETTAASLRAAVSDPGNTPARAGVMLTRAAAGNDQELFDILEAVGADPFAVGEDGRCAADVLEAEHGKSAGPRRDILAARAALLGVPLAAAAESTGGRRGLRSFAKSDIFISR